MCIHWHLWACTCICTNEYCDSSPGYRSLVSTNTRLLQEIEEMKRNHTMEISQLQTNYEQLRKTLQKMKL